MIFYPFTWNDLGFYPQRDLGSVSNVLTLFSVCSNNIGSLSSQVKIPVLPTLIALLMAGSSVSSAVNVDLSGAATGTIINAPGASFAQTFTGQSVVGVGLSGSPSGPLSLQAAGSLSVAFFDPGVSAASNSILPQPNNSAPLAVLLDQAADSITWTMGSAQPPSSVTIDFFSASGTLVNSVTQALSSGYNVYNFSGLGTFKGLSIYDNNDPAGLRFQNFSYNAAGGGSVPDSGSSLALLGAGLLLLATLRRQFARA